MSQGEWFTTYLQYEDLNDLLNVILYTSQSFMAITPSLYHVTYKNKEILFVHTGMVGGVVAHFLVIAQKPTAKYIEFNKKTFQSHFVDSVGSNQQSIYIPIVKLIKSTLLFPLDTD
jgi:N-acetyl-anhydromuramyl-L-alanine amidase AmpD